MGTRGLIGHIVRGKKKGSYNHFDSYPSGQGIRIVNFIRGLSAEQLDTMIENLDKLEWIDWDSIPAEELQQRYSNAGFLNLQVNKRTSADWYCLLNNVPGAAAVPRILDGSLGHLPDNTDFEDDKLFCEWVYWIDWDRKALTVSGGCKPAENNFAELTADWMKSIKRSDDEESD